MASAKPARMTAQFNTGMSNAAKAENFDTLTSQAGAARAALTGGRDSGIGAVRDAEGRSIASLDQYYGQARDDLNGGFDTAQGDLNSSVDVWRPAYDAGNSAIKLRSDFLGTGGDGAASAAALDTFRGSTGYEDMANEARDGAMRSQNRIGVLAGGNTLDAITRLSSSLADRSAQQWLGNLGQDADRGMTAAGGMATGYRSLADLAAQRGSQLASMAQTQGARKADVYGGAGRSIADLFAGTGGQMAGVETGLGNALAGNTTQMVERNMQQATDASNASMAAKNANQNLALGVAGMGVKLLSGGVGGIPGLGGGGSLSNAAGSALGFKPFASNM